ncbi:MAG: hypothetical protein NVSMB54_15660 [Ktedonobacteraceae bacterium]
MSEHHGMTVVEMRQVALSAVRGILRSQEVDPLQVSAYEAHEVLDDLARTHPDLIASRWYRSASSAQIALFYHHWEAWRKETQRLSSPHR